MSLCDIRWGLGILIFSTLVHSLVSIPNRRKMTIKILYDPIVIFMVSKADRLKRIQRFFYLQSVPSEKDYPES